LCGFVWLCCGGGGFQTGFDFQADHPSGKPQTNRGAQKELSESEWSRKKVRQGETKVGENTANDPNVKGAPQKLSKPSVEPCGGLTGNYWKTSVESPRKNTGRPQPELTGKNLSQLGKEKSCPSQRRWGECTPESHKNVGKSRGATRGVRRGRGVSRKEKVGKKTVKKKKNFREPSKRHDQKKGAKRGKC